MLSRNKGKKAGRAAGAGGRKSEENFTAEEVAVFRASFDLARRKDKPTKDTGAIRTEEISAALVGVGLVPTAKEFDTMKKLMDPQSSGEVDFASFFSTIASYIRPVYTEAELEAVFNEIAGPNCDVIDDKTMQLCIHHLGMDLTLERCQEVIREVDRTGDCTINRADFIAWIQEHRT